ncbi:hypothetical protein [Alginatibacterium sediminis]|uniref:hypothetical protein n=1 Tax=Alginatibacterium sediminis TaxID=2164068 RepID=UPI0011C37B1A|nr:hypothetical protein [Alginatibacterium sediminis]
MNKKQTTLKVFLLILGIYFVLWLPVLLWPEYLDTTLGFIVASPVLSIYLLSALGIPGLIQNAGACGWNFCAPSLLGWVFIVTLCLFICYLLATCISSLIRRLIVNL